MNRVIILVTFWFVMVPALVSPAIDAVDARTSETNMQSVRFVRCFQDTELSESLATLKLHEGAEVARVYESLRTKAKTSPGCRTEIIEALIRGLEQASKDTTNQNEKYFFWENGASLLGELNATEALDLLIANIDLTDGWSASISQSHFPALTAIIRIGAPAIPKLQVVVGNDSVPYRRKFAAFCIAYIGGDRAKRALTSAVSGETDPCVKNFLRLSLQAFDNRAKPNHISSALNGKWLSAFYCL
ncbi:MAG TPA: hypothetical protein VJ875_17170 [Pyrinomonadaceae bacterium]|nr:hypothetical protein [Pyrinomonadaceae bacterium]